jgi:hypothetical protein
VQENDRRLILLEEREGDTECVIRHEPLYAPSILLLVDVSTSQFTFSYTQSQDRKYRAYQELIRYVPMVKKQIDTLEAHELQGFYRAVSASPKQYG